MPAPSPARSDVAFPPSAAPEREARAARLSLPAKPRTWGAGARSEGRAPVCPHSPKSSTAKSGRQCTESRETLSEFIFAALIPLSPAASPCAHLKRCRSGSPALAAGSAPAAAVTQRGPEQHRRRDLRCSAVCVWPRGRQDPPARPSTDYLQALPPCSNYRRIMGTGIAAEVSALPADTGCDSSASVLACCHCRGITKGSATQGLGDAPGTPGTGLCCNLLCALGADCRVRFRLRLCLQWLWGDACCAFRKGMGTLRCFSCDCEASGSATFCW